MNKTLPAFLVAAIIALGVAAATDGRPRRVFQVVAALAFGTFLVVAYHQSCWSCQLKWLRMRHQLGSYLME